MAEEKKAKARIPSAKKRDLQSEKNRIRNKAFRSKVSTTLKALQGSDAANAKENLNAVYSIMDRGVKKGVFTQNKANRVKSRITKKLATKS